MNSVINPFTAQSLFARPMRGSVLTAGPYPIAQTLRLISNLILTRILFPEAFGVMALATLSIWALVIGGLLGAASKLVMALLLHPAIALLARWHRAWNADHDGVFFALSTAMAVIVLWINADLLGLWVFCRYEVAYKTG